MPGYEILGVLGRGGFGVVYRARQLTIDREVALKVDSRVILDDRDQRRFLREVRAAGRLSGHPNVVEIYDAGVLSDGRPYIVMELCTGGSLAGRAPMTPADVVGIGQQLADALATAHGLGVLHRDIKPGNILIKRYGTVGLADFGLAALIETGRDSSVTLAALTPAYAPPEAFHLETPTPRSDVYALGATLYALLAGRPPRFPPDGELSVPEIIRLHDAPVPDLPGIPTSLTSVLRCALAKDPRQRYQDAAALRDDLARLSGNSQPSVITEPIRVPVPVPQRFGFGETTGTRRSRRPVLLAGAALMAIVVLLGVWFFLAQGRDDGGGGGGSAGSPSIAAVDTEKQFGARTITEGCPAASVDSQARCVERAECWSGPVLINGEVTNIRQLPCDQEHSWETFAIAPLPPEISSPYQDVLEANARVAKVCAMETLLASRYGKVLEFPTDWWQATVLPPTPDDRAAQRSIYRCLGSITEGTPVGTAFRPRQ